MIVINTLNQKIEERDSLSLMNNSRLNKPFNLENLVFVLRTTDINLPAMFVEMNNLTCSLLEYSRRELLDMTLCDLIADDCGNILDNKKIDLLQEEFVKYEISLKKKFGGNIKLVVDSFIFQSDDNIVEFAVAKAK